MRQKTAAFFFQSQNPLNIEEWSSYERKVEVEKLLNLSFSDFMSASIEKKAEQQADSLFSKPYAQEFLAYQLMN